ncbi:hypothetical protein V2J09_001736 [Rumex salicifolius]
MEGDGVHHQQQQVQGRSRRFIQMQLGLMVASILVLLSIAEVEAWSKEGHIITCRIAQDLLEEEAEAAIRELLPEQANGDLSAVCGWADQIRIFHKYRWTSPLHYIVTPDYYCDFDYQRDCVDDYGNEDMCVAGAILNFTSQLQHYKQPASASQYNFTEALLFLSHFVGDIHQPLHIGFEGDEGGNTIALRWFKRKSNLHHGAWAKDVPSWMDCDDLNDCVNKYATESVKIACRQAYKGVKSGVILSDKYFNSRLPFVMKRIAQGGIRLAMILNDVFSDDGGT